MGSDPQCCASKMVERDAKPVIAQEGHRARVKACVPAPLFSLVCIYTPGCTHFWFPTTHLYTFQHIGRRCAGRRASRSLCFAPEVEEQRRIESPGQLPRLLLLPRVLQHPHHLQAVTRPLHLPPRLALCACRFARRAARRRRRWAVAGGITGAGGARVLLKALIGRGRRAGAAGEGRALASSSTRAAVFPGDIRDASIAACTCPPPPPHPAPPSRSRARARARAPLEGVTRAHLILVLPQHVVWPQRCALPPRPAVHEPPCLRGL